MASTELGAKIVAYPCFIEAAAPHPEPTVFRSAIERYLGRHRSRG